MRNASARVQRRQHQAVGVDGRRAAAQVRKLRELMDEAKEHVPAFIAYPRERWPWLASTGPVERLNREIKRRAPVVWIIGYPGEERGHG